MELYWSCTGVEKWFKRLRIYLPVVLWGGRRPAAGCRRPKDGAGQRPAGAWLEFLALARCVGYVGGKRSKPKAQPQGGGRGAMELL